MAQAVGYVRKFVTWLLGGIMAFCFGTGGPAAAKPVPKPAGGVTPEEQTAHTAERRQAVSAIDDWLAKTGDVKSELKRYEAIVGGEANERPPMQQRTVVVRLLNELCQLQKTLRALGATGATAVQERLRTSRLEEESLLQDGDPQHARRATEHGVMLTALQKSLRPSVLLLYGIHPTYATDRAPSDLPLDAQRLNRLFELMTVQVEDTRAMEKLQQQLTPRR